MFINVENQDFGLMETRDCDCPLYAHGYSQHLLNIGSYSRLTTEGITLLSTDISTILEEILPRSFGGTPLDYQLVEEESPSNFTKLSLIVHPRIHIREVDYIKKVFLAALGHLSCRAARSTSFLRVASSLRVERREPEWNTAGKFMPLRVRERLEKTD